MEVIDDNVTFEDEGGYDQFLPLASPGDRFVAVLIDWILMGALNFVPYIGWAAAVAYYLLRDALPFLDGQSLGKKAIRLRVLDEYTGMPITEKYDKAAIRMLSQFIPVFNLIDAVMVFSDDKKRFGDKWAGTVVVKEE
jgi:uncharacterized RDD family membrane protein YckC